MFHVCHRSKDLDSTLVCSAALFPRQPAQVRVTDFFGSVPRIAASAAAASGGTVGADGRKTVDTAAAAAAAAATAPTAYSDLTDAKTATAADPAAHAGIRSEKDASGGHEQPSAPSAAPGLQLRQGSEQSAEGAMPGWASHQDERTDVPLLLAWLAVVVAAAAASRWSGGQAAA